MGIRELAKKVAYKLSGRIQSYNEVHAIDAASRISLPGCKVLVVGANTGADCWQFIRLGAGEVHGLDVIPEVGSEFQHSRLIYHQQSIEKSTLPSNSFDLVFSVATMEHVHDIGAGYTEMARLLKPGGIIYSVASPLWFSPYGHHMGCFDGHPWIHLTHDRDEIVAYARDHGIDGERGIVIDSIVDYMLDARFFNMLPAKDYASATTNLDGIIILENQLLREDSALLDHPLGQKALSLSYSPDELLPVTHRFIAGKRTHPRHLM